MKLSDKDLARIKELHQQFIDSFKTNTSMSNFDQALEVFRSLETIKNAFSKMFEPYIEKFNRVSLKDHGIFKFYYHARAKHLEKDIKEMMETAEKMMHCDPAELKSPDLIFSRMPQVIYYYVGDEKINSTGLFSSGSKPVYTMTFSDHNTLKLDSLVNNDEINQARETFNAKMSVLASDQSLVTNMKP